MKITNRFVEPIPVNTIIDAQDGSRVAMRPGAQTFYGTKNFENLRVDSDPNKGDKSLINVADMNSALAEAGMLVKATENVTLSAANITAKSATLRNTPQEGSIVKFSLDGSGELNSVSDFSVSGNTISWADDPRLCGILEAGDVLYVRYWTILKE